MGSLQGQNGIQQKHLDNLHVCKQTSFQNNGNQDV